MQDREQEKWLFPPQKKEIPDVIWAGIPGTYETQAISDDSRREPETGMAIPDDRCVEEGKNWVDSNEK